MTWIYVLVDPRNDEVRYVGKADNPHVRLRGHLWSAQHPTRGNTHCGAWIRSLLDEGLTPVVQAVEEIPVEEWQAAERRWISFLKGKGVRLVNGTDGGEGGAMPPDVTARGAAKRRGQKRSTETRQRMSDAKKGVAKSPEHVEVIRQALKGRTDFARRGEKNNAKLTSTQVLEIRRLRAEGFLGVEVARMFNITPACVSLIYSGKSWSHLNSHIVGLQEGVK